MQLMENYPQIGIIPLPPFFCLNFGSGFAVLGLMELEALL